MQGMWQTIIILQLLHWSAAEKTADNENSKQQPPIFNVKQLYNPLANVR